MRQPSPRSKVERVRFAGVSLLGVLISLCGIALLAIWAIPAFFEREGLTLDNVGILLARDLRSAQNRATLLGAGARFVLDRDGWRALDAAGAPLLGGGEQHTIERRFSVDGVFEGVTLEQIDVGAGGAIEISSRGSVGNGGQFVAQFHGERRAIQIQRGSGQVIVVGRDEPLLNPLK